MSSTPPQGYPVGRADADDNKNQRYWVGIQSLLATLASGFPVAAKFLRLVAIFANVLKTNTTPTAALNLASSEGGSGLQINLVGGASQAVRAVQLQTLDFAGTSSGTLALQPNGGGVSAPANSFSVNRLNYLQAADLSVVVVGATWTDFVANQTFTVGSASGFVEVSVGGVALGVSNAAATYVGARMMLDSAGTPLTRLIGTGRQAAGDVANAMSGSGVQVFTGLAAGSHTVKVQVRSALAGTFTCSALTNPDRDALSIVVTERIS